MPRWIEFECEDCGHRVRVPTFNMYLTWLAWWRVRWHHFWCHTELP